MKNKKSTKRALLASLMAMLLSISMLMGTTYAWFTDSVSSGSNVITTGNLDIEVEYTLDGENWNNLDGANDLFQKSYWEPGHTEVVALRIVNAGSLALKYNAHMNIFRETVGKTKAGEDIVLSNILTVTTMHMDGGAIGDVLAAYAFNSEDAIPADSWFVESTFKTANILGENQLLLPNTTKYLLIKVDMDETVGNEANHDGINVPSIEFGVNVLATQYTYENDTFGNGYDSDAAFDELWGAIADVSWYNEDATEFTLTGTNQLAGLAELVNTGVDSFEGKKFTLAGDLDLNNTRWFPIGTSTNPFAGDFDGNGNTISNINVAGEGKYQGLFGCVKAGSKISNLELNNVAVIDKDSSDETVCYGAVVGYCNGAITLENVTVTGNVQVSSEWYVGGLVGRSKGATFTNCSVIAEAGSVIYGGRYAGAISGYDNGAMKIVGCTVENVEIDSTYCGGSLAGLGAAGANIHGNTVKNTTVVLNAEGAADAQSYGTVIGGVALYSYSTKPITFYDNTCDNVTCTVNGEAAEAQDIGAKFADGTDQGLIMLPTVKVGNARYTYMKLATAAAAKDGSETVIELTGDTMITLKFKPSVAKNQNIVIKTNGYDLIWVEQDASKMPVVDENGNLVTTVVTAENIGSYFKVAAGGTVTIE